MGWLQEDNDGAAFSTFKHNKGGMGTLKHAGTIRGNRPTGTLWSGLVGAR